MSEGRVNSVLTQQPESGYSYVRQNGETVFASSMSELLSRCEVMAKLAASSSVEFVENIAKVYALGQQKLEEKAKILTDQGDKSAEKIIRNSPKVESIKVRIVDTELPSQYIETETPPSFFIKPKVEEIHRLTNNEEIHVRSLLISDEFNKNEIKSESVIKIPHESSLEKTKIYSREVIKINDTNLEEKIILNPTNQKNNETSSQNDENLQMELSNKNIDLTEEAFTSDNHNNLDDPLTIPIELATDDEILEAQNSIDDILSNPSEYVAETSENDILSPEVNPVLLKVGEEIYSEELELEIKNEMDIFYKESSAQSENNPIEIRFKGLVEAIRGDEEIEDFGLIISQVDRVIEVYESFSRTIFDNSEIKAELINSFSKLLSLLGVEKTHMHLSEYLHIYDLEFLIKNIIYLRILINERYRKEFNNSQSKYINISSYDDSDVSIFSWFVSFLTLIIYIPVT